MDLTNENVIHIKNNGVQYIQFRKLLEFQDEITHAFTIGLENDYRMPRYGEKNNILTLDEIRKNERSYKKLCNSLEINYNNIVKTNQVHGDLVNCIDKKINFNKPDFHEAEYKNTDGLVTNKSNLAICATNADCIVLMFYDPKKKVIANVHSGWRGTIQKIAKKTIEKMKEIYNCNPKDIICCVSPSIRQCHFEVDKDVKDIFEKSFTNIDDKIIKKQEKWFIDTVEINKAMLKESGLKNENIIDSKICTVCNSHLIHSYRGANKHNGLEMGIIELKK